MNTTAKKSNNVTVNNAENKEEIVMMTKMTKEDYRNALEVAGITMSDSAFKKTKKAELIDMFEKCLEEETTVEKETVAVGDLDITKDNAPAEEPPAEKKEETVVDEKVRNRRLLLNLLCYRWVAEYRLFFKSNKYKKGGEFCYIASRKRQLGVTCKVLKDLGWQANPATLDRVAEILREEGMVVSATRDVYIPTPMWEKLVSGKQFLDKKKGNKDIVAYLKEVI